MPSTMPGTGDRKMNMTELWERPPLKEMIEIQWHISFIGFP